MWEARQRWDLDRVKAKASCPDSAEVGKRKEKAHMCGQVYCRSELALGQREALPARGPGQVPRVGPFKQQVRRPGGVTSGRNTEPATRWSLAPSLSSHPGPWLLRDSGWARTWTFSQHNLNFK